MRPVKLSGADKVLLQALAEGWTLRSHRYLSGVKVYLLHPLSGEPRLVGPASVEHLLRYGLIQSNQKFPVATYLLTDEGKQAVAALKRQNREGLHRQSK